MIVQHTLLVVTLKVIICINNTWNRPCIEQVSFNHLWRSLEMLDHGRKSFIIEELLHEIPWQFSSSLCEKTPHRRKLKSCSIYWRYTTMELYSLDINEIFFPSFILSSTSLFRNKRFALNKMFQRNASKFAIFYV